MSIKTWQAREFEANGYVAVSPASNVIHMQVEINELRAALKERDFTISHLERCTDTDAVLRVRNNQQIDELRAALAERDAEIEQLKSIAYSDDGAGGEGMKLFLMVRAQRKVLEQALEALEAGENVLEQELLDHPILDKALAAITAIQEQLK